MRTKGRDFLERKQAKAMHKLNKLENPYVYAQMREELATAIIQSIMAITPRWGGLKITLEKS